MAVEREADSAQNHFKVTSLVGAVMEIQPVLWTLVFCCSTLEASITWTAKAQISARHYY